MLNNPCLSQALLVTLRQLDTGAVEAFAIDGKPADCTMLALHGPLFQAGNCPHLHTFACAICVSEDLGMAVFFWTVEYCMIVTACTRSTQPIFH